MALHSSILAWKIALTEGPGRLQSMGSQRVRQAWAHTHPYSTVWIVLCRIESWDVSCNFFFLALLFSIQKDWLVDTGRLLVVQCVWFFATPWTIAHQAALSMEFSRQEYWSGVPFPTPEELPNPGIKPRSPALQADSLPTEPPGQHLMRS